MKKEKVLNPNILSAIASLGHTEYLCIADCGLPIPKDVPTIDVSVSAGIPKFIDVLRSVESELVIESYICASEIDSINQEMMKQIESILNGKKPTKVSHEEFKDLTKKAKCIIRTGETSPYANVILVGGVNF
jgi:D-ribose pyranase